METRNGKSSILLKKLGISPALNGWNYLTEAINLVIEDRSYLNAITKRLYPDVAKRCGSTPSRVERCIHSQVIHNNTIVYCGKSIRTYRVCLSYKRTFYSNMCRAHNR